MFRGLLPPYCATVLHPVLYCITLYCTVCTAAPIVGWGRYEHFEYGCCIAFSDPSLNSRSYVVTALIAVFFLPICK